jgi:uncharacterized protein (DUF2336 family)
VDAQRSLIVDVEDAIASGSPDQRIDALRGVTDLFLTASERYSDAQLLVFDDVIGRLAERIEIRARIELARRLAPVANAPVTVIRSLAHDEAIEVAGPVLTQSPRLTEADLLACASGKSQDRLLALSKRASISEALSDVLVTEGNRDVVRSVAGNDGARFSDQGFGKLVEHSVDDDALAVCVGMRKDIPKEHFHALVSKASEAVFKKLSSAMPEGVGEVNRVLVQLTGHRAGPDGKMARDHSQAEIAFAKLQQSGRLVERAVQLYASAGKVEEIAVALASLCQLPIDVVERVLSDKRADNDLALLLVKAAGWGWPTAKLILEMRRGPGGLSPQAIMTSYQRFERLQTATAKRVVRFYHIRHASGDTAKLS